MKDAAEELRYLLDRGYLQGTALRVVADHHRLPQLQRYLLARVVVATSTARSRKEKAIPLEALQGEGICIDGYNVIITLESIISGREVYLADDGFLRDLAGIFRSYSTTSATGAAIDALLDVLKRAQVSWAEVLLDRPISRSGELANTIGMQMNAWDIPGVARTSAHVDHELKKSQAVVATADGNVIDACQKVIDLPAEVARAKGIQVIPMDP